MTSHRPDALGRPIVIVGMDRSGTSVVANMVHAWGAHGGEEEPLAKGNRWNQHGYWEHQELKQLTGELLHQSGVRYWQPGYRDVLQRRAQEPRLRRRVERFVAAMARGHAFWFCKEPWLSVQLPFWRGFWRDPIYVITVRNPLDSAESMTRFRIPAKETGISVIAYMLLRWQLFLLSILGDVPHTSPKLFVEYESLITTPQAEAERLCAFLGRQSGVAPEARVAAVSRVVRTDLGHGRGLPFHQAAIATREQQALYAFLRNKVIDPDLPFDASAYPMYPGYVEYFDNMARLLPATSIRLGGDYMSDVDPFPLRARRLVQLSAARAAFAMSGRLDALRSRYATVRQFFGGRGARPHAK